MVRTLGGVRGALRLPVLTPMLQRRGQRRLRRVMRGYRRLKQEGQLGLIASLQRTLTDTPLERVNATASPLIFGAATGSAELVVRQYLLLRVFRSLNLPETVLHAGARADARLVHPLPAQWRTLLAQHGIAVARIQSSLAWATFLVMMLGYGVVSIAGRAIAAISATVRRESQTLGRHAYFNALVKGNLPQPGADGQSHDIVTWYSQWHGRIAPLDAICHDVTAAPPTTVNGIRVVSAASPVPPLFTVVTVSRYVIWGAAATLLAAVDLIRGRWWHALMLAEAAMAGAVRMHEPGKMAADYLFHNAAWLYRPLWTYDAQHKGSRITFYFYSTNCESFKQPDGYPAEANSWTAMNWPLYLVWDSYQADFVRRVVGDGADIRVVGPIWFHTSAEALPVLSSPAVAVFDVQPHRPSRYQILGAAQEYFTPITANQFLIDVHAVLTAHGAEMVLKRKRDIGSLVHPHYVSALKRLEAAGGLTCVDPDVSALRVIEKCHAVISMPFSTTALLGRHLGKPSIYYDPHGIIFKDDRGAHGVPVVTGVAELEHWIAAHVPSNAEQTPAPRDMQPDHLSAS